MTTARTLVYTLPRISGKSKGDHLLVCDHATLRPQAHKLGRLGQNSRERRPAPWLYWLIVRRLSGCTPLSDTAKWDRCGCPEHGLKLLNDLRRLVARPARGAMAAETRRSEPGPHSQVRHEEDGPNSTRWSHDRFSIKTLCYPNRDSGFVLTRGELAPPPVPAGPATRSVI